MAIYILCRLNLYKSFWNTLFFNFWFFKRNIQNCTIQFFNVIQTMRLFRVNATQHRNKELLIRPGESDLLNEGCVVRLVLSNMFYYQSSHYSGVLVVNLTKYTHIVLLMLSKIITNESNTHRYKDTRL